MRRGFHYESWFSFLLPRFRYYLDIAFVLEGFFKTLRGLVYGIRSEVDEVTTATWIDHHLEDLEGAGIKLKD